MNKEETLLIKKLSEKADRAYYSNIKEYSSFLDLNEQEVFKWNLKEFKDVNYVFYGGYPEAERKIICFYNSDLSIDVENMSEYPVSILKVTNNSTQRCSHRDYLGAVLNLGITRDLIGDIIVIENSAYVYCMEHISDYICDNLTQVKNCCITIFKEDKEALINIKPEYTLIKGSVSSLRIDSIVKLAFSMSRTNSQSLILGKKVFINSKPVEKISQLIQQNDIISVRGIGKCRISKIGELTKKSRIIVEIYYYK